MLLKCLIVSLVIVWGECSLTQNMDPGKAMGLLLKAKSCYPTMTDQAYGMLTTVDCGRTRCNFPSEACFMVRSQAFTSNDRICRPIPSNCRQEADQIDNSGSGGGGGGGNTQPPQTQRTQAPQTQPPRTQPPQTVRTFPTRGGGSGSATTPSSSTSNDCTSPFEIGDRCASGPAFVQRWYYMPQTRRCQSTYYRGCGGNSNNYLSLSDCENACENNNNVQTTPAPASNRCSLDLETCTDGRFRSIYYYRESARRCQRTFSKCDPSVGNKNAFADINQCMRECLS